MAEKQKLTDDQRLRILEGKLEGMQATINHMQRMGGFADSKTLSMRCHHIEQRLELNEFDLDMLKDNQASVISFAEDHLKTAHKVDLSRSEEVAPTMLRKIRHRLIRWADARGLWQKRNGVREARQSENRLKPASV